MNLPIDLRLAKMPEGPAAPVGPAFGLITAFIWSFAENIEGARRFLVDYIGHSRQALLTSGFHKMPVWPATVPELAAIVTDDPVGGSPGTYSLLAEAATWTTNIGHPGHTNAAISEIFNRGLIPSMFASQRPASSRPKKRSIRPTERSNASFRSGRKGARSDLAGRALVAAKR